MKNKTDRYQLAGRVQIIGGIAVAVWALITLSTVLLAILVGMGAGALVYSGINDLREATEMKKGSAVT